MSRVEPTRHPAKEPLPETREVVEGKSAATPFAFLGGVGLVVLGLAGLVVLVVLLVAWLF